MDVLNNHQALLDQQFRSQKFHFFLIAALSFVMLFANLHRGDLSGYDDAAYAHEGKQMLLTGDWWNVRLNGHLDFDKPPMFIWLEALSMKFFGISDFAAKFPSALLGLGTILLVFFITRDLTDQFWLPILAMLILTCTQYFMKYAMHAMTGVPFTFFFTLAIFFYIKGLKRPGYLLMCGAAISFALLTRSPMGAVPLTIIVIHLFFIRRTRLLWSKYLIGCFLLALLPPAIWYLLQYRLHGDYFLSEHFSNIMAHAVSTQPKSPWERIAGYFHYPYLLLKLYWPWLPLMVMGLVMQLKKALHSRDLAGSLLIIWVVCVVLPFSLAESKVLRYILEAFPAFSIFAAIPLNIYIPSDRKDTWFKAAYLLLILAAVLISVSPTYRLRAEDMRKLAPIAEALTSPGQRVLLYTHGELQVDYRNQLIWYAERLCKHLTDMEEVKSMLEQAPHTVVIMDKGTFTHLFNNLDSHTEILGESENFVCFKRAVRSTHPTLGNSEGGDR